MEISHAKILITFLFCLDTTFPETIEIIRTLVKRNGKKANWRNGVDSFNIPQSVCYIKNSTYGNYCNMSCTLDDTVKHGSYLCFCSRQNSTVANFKNKWSCMQNEEVRKRLGCEVNATLFFGEKKEDKLRTLVNGTIKERKTRLKNLHGSCTINANSSWYIGCLGKKVRLGLHTEMFLLQRRSNKSAYSIKVNKSIEPILRGKVINLGITCKPPTPIAEGCLVFKLKGNFTRPVDASTKPVISSTINPRTTSIAVMSLSTATRPTSGGKQKNDDVSSFSQSGIIVGVSVSAAFLLFTLTAILFICRRCRSREDTQTSTSDQSNKDTRSVSRNTKTNSELELDGNNGYGTCQDPLTSIYASRYEVPQQQRLQGPLCNQKTISPVGNSQSDGAYATLNIPEGHHIYGPGNVQEPVYALQDPEIMFQNHCPGINQPMYYALEDLLVKDSVESVNNGPPDSEPVHNVLEDPEEMFQNYGSGIDQPVYYALEDLSVKNAVQSVDNGPTEREPVYNVLEEPCKESAEEPGCHSPVTMESPVYNTLEEPNPYAGYPGKTEPVYKVLEAPGLSGTKTNDDDPEHNVLEGPEPDESSEVGCLVLKRPGDSSG